METQQVRTCFTITFTVDQYTHAKSYVDDMKSHPKRVFWVGKEGKSEEELVYEQIAHRILSGFYNNDAFQAAKHIIKMEAMSKS